MDRLIPDLIRGFVAGEQVAIRLHIPLVRGSTSWSQYVDIFSWPNGCRRAKRASHPRGTLALLRKTHVRRSGLSVSWQNNGHRMRLG